MNWNLKLVKQMIRQESDTQTIIAETGIKQAPLQRIVACMNMSEGRLYNIDGLFDSDIEDSAL